MEVVPFVILVRLEVRHTNITNLLWARHGPHATQLLLAKKVSHCRDEQR